MTNGVPLFIASGHLDASPDILSPKYSIQCTPSSKLLSRCACPSWGLLGIAQASLPTGEGHPLTPAETTLWLTEVMTTPVIRATGCHLTRMVVQWETDE